MLQKFLYLRMFIRGIFAPFFMCFYPHANRAYVQANGFSWLNIKRSEMTKS